MLEPQKWSFQFKVVWSTENVSLIGWDWQTRAPDDPNQMSETKLSWESRGFGGKRWDCGFCTSLSRFSALGQHMLHSFI